MTQQRAADEMYCGLEVPRIASFVAGRALGYATAYLDGRDDIAALARHADKLVVESLIAWDGTEELSDPTRLLIVTMMRTSCATGARLDRWRSVMAAMVHLVQGEVRSFHAERSQ